MSKTERLNSPAELVAIARAAHIVGDLDLKRAAVGALATHFGIRIRFPKLVPQKGVADGCPDRATPQATPKGGE